MVLDASLVFAPQCILEAPMSAKPVDLDTAIETQTALIRSAAALERLAKLPDAVSHLARAIETLGERIEFGLCTIAGKFGE